MSVVSTKMLQAAAGASPKGAWDLSYAYYDPPEALKWDLGAAIGWDQFSVNVEDDTARGLFFKPDGTKLYVAGNQRDRVNEYALSVPWVVSTASFVQFFSVQAQDFTPNDVFFKPDGTKMYVVGDAGDDVNEYTLSTAWDISTASYLQNFSVSSQDASPKGLFFREDGSKMYIAGSTGINEYSLSTAWDISTASYLQNYSASGTTSIGGISFKADGTEMYLISTGLYRIDRYSLSTAWDISSASFIDTPIGFGSNSGVENLFVSPDGLWLYTIGRRSSGAGLTSQVEAYTLGGFDVGAQETVVTDLFFKPDGTKMYIVGSGQDEINEYNLSISWDISTSSYLQNFSVATQEATPIGLSFKPDGTKMYVIGSSGDDVNEYALSTAWDISTAIYQRVFSVATQETNPSGLFFKPDGTKMYIIGTNGDAVNEYNLSTAWNISTASYLQNFSVGTEETSATGLFFKPDGTKMYVIGLAGDEVNEYNLSTAWDVSSASFSQVFRFYGGNPSGLFFKEDGTKMFVSFPTTNDAIYSYTLGPQP